MTDMSTTTSRTAPASTHRSHLIYFVVELLIIVCAGLGAFLLRFEFSIPPAYLPHMSIALFCWIPVKLAVFHVCGLHRRWWKYFSISDAVRLGMANVIASGIALALILSLAPAFPRSLPIMDLLFCVTAAACVPVAARAIREIRADGEAAGQPVIVYGAGGTGVALVRELRANPRLGYTVVGFVDDDPAMVRMYVQGTPVLGRGSDLADVVARSRATAVLIAAPSATGQQMTQLLNYCRHAGVKFRMVRPMSEMIEGAGLASQIRDVDVQDLLCRSQVRLDDKEIRNRVEGKVVLVTGAAGSIGSELCHQLARFRPAALIGYDIAETALFYLERDMLTRFRGVRFHPEIGSVQNALRIHEILERYRPSVVYHSAAYKHVPLMESSVFEAIENNVLGTWTVASEVRKQGVNDFVLISSDKAVRPVSMMGATKRFCEVMLLSIRDGPTRYMAVRFGNVLGSNGSVIPVFKEQISRGGPVTVTHPEMRRYFMTIPEAAQLVLQASAMGRGGEIFVLDMGEPIKIVDLASNLILLSGLRPDIDIKIEFTGIRPGEKISEDLSLFNEETLPTRHEQIKVLSGNGLPDEEMTYYLPVLREICSARDLSGLILFLKEVVPEYNPSAHVLRQLIGEAEPAQVLKPRPAAARDILHATTARA